MKRFFRRTLVLWLLLVPAGTYAFSFAEYENTEQAAEAAAAAPEVQLSDGCKAKLSGHRIGTMIGEIHRDERTGRWGYWGYWLANDDPDRDPRFGTRKSVYGDLVDNLNQDFRSLGLSTYTAEEITAQVAREEQEAFLNNDLDAAMSAAERLAADFMLKGLISTRTLTNKVVGIEEVFVTIDLSLFDRNGQQLATTQIKQTAFSDADVSGTIIAMVKKNAGNITRTLLSEYCRGGTIR